MARRLTEEVRKVIFHARREARKRASGHVSPEHLLLGLIRENDSGAARLLRGMGVPPEWIRGEEERELPPGDGLTGAELQFALRAKRVIDIAGDEASPLDNDYIGTEHLLLALIHDDGGLASRVLRKFGIQLELMRAGVASLQAANDANALDDCGQGAVPEPESTLIGESIRASGNASVWDRFTDEARRVVYESQLESELLGRSTIATEHVLLSLVRDENGSAARARAGLGVSPKTIRSDVERLVVQGDEPQGSGVNLTEGCKRAITLAANEANILISEYIAPEHILLGLIREGDGLAARVLSMHRIDLDAARKAIGSSRTEQRRPPRYLVRPAHVVDLVSAFQVVFQLAMEEVRGEETGSDLGTQHLLFALIRDKESTAGRYLAQLGIDVNRARAEIAEMLTERTVQGDSSGDDTDSASGDESV